MSHYLVFFPWIEQRKGTIFINFLYASCCFKKSKMLPFIKMKLEMRGIRNVFFRPVMANLDCTSPTVQ